MKKLTTVFVSVAFLFIMGCSNETIPNHLVFEGESEHWKGSIEIEQSKSVTNEDRYNYKESLTAEYTGDDVDEIKESAGEYPISWEKTGNKDMERMGGSHSHFQEQIGNVPGGSYRETSAADFYAEEQTDMQIEIQWGDTEETITLIPTKEEYEEE
ncbi:hypothetical protein D7Z54_24725 [Salibacterium salarium]|uniref:Uncharacterized protein n=1 Tax=Salibacterium salarium TaxID=284579 RepID=A0A428MX20_9BACI|nr:hypothetical protein [Salibacterium salarium]RSL30705.1 hypothetical protein D7Z54_24725 [Salibacterium salarium]